MTEQQESRDKRGGDKTQTRENTKVLKKNECLIHSQPQEGANMFSQSRL